MLEPQSVSNWLDELKAGNEAAAQALFERYLHSLVRLARQRLGTQTRSLADEEDVAITAFNSFLGRADAGQFPQLDDRTDLWRILVKLTLCKVYDAIEYNNRQKRGGAAKDTAAAQQSDPEFLVCPDPTPALAAQLTDEVQHRLTQLQKPELILIAKQRMDGYTTEEIAAQLNCHPTTIERKLRTIRQIWSHPSPHETPTL